MKVGDLVQWVLTDIPPRWGIIVDLDDETRVASEIINEGVIRPVITSRVIVDSTEPVNEYAPFSPMAKDNWLHSFPHEEA